MKKRNLYDLILGLADKLPKIINAWAKYKKVGKLCIALAVINNLSDILNAIAYLVLVFKI